MSEQYGYTANHDEYDAALDTLRNLDWENLDQAQTEHVGDILWSDIREKYDNVPEFLKDLAEPDTDAGQAAHQYIDSLKEQIPEEHLDDVATAVYTNLVSEMEPQQGLQELRANFLAIFGTDQSNQYQGDDEDEDYAEYMQDRLHGIESIHWKFEVSVPNAYYNHTHEWQEKFGEHSPQMFYAADTMWSHINAKYGSPEAFVETMLSDNNASSEAAKAELQSMLSLIPKENLAELAIVMDKLNPGERKEEAGTIFKNEATLAEQLAYVAEAERDERAALYHEVRKESGEKIAQYFLEHIEDYSTHDTELAAEIHTLLSEGTTDHRPDWMTDPEKQRNLMEIMANFKESYSPDQATLDILERDPYGILANDPERTVYSQIVEASTKYINDQIHDVAEHTLLAHDLRDSPTFDPNTYDVIVANLAQHHERRIQEQVSNVAYTLWLNDEKLLQEAVAEMNGTHDTLMDAIQNGPNEYYMGQPMAWPEFQQAKIERFEALSQVMNQASTYGNREAILNGMTSEDPTALGTLAEFIDQQMTGDQHLMTYAMARLATYVDGTQQSLDYKYSNETDTSYNDRQKDEEQAINRYKELVQQALENIQQGVPAP